MTDFFLSSQEAGDVLGASRALMSLWRQGGKGPAFESHPSSSARYGYTRFAYRLDAVLAFLASRGVNKTRLKAIKRKVITTRRLTLARKADAARIAAMTAIRVAHTARAAAADAGHKPSVKILTNGEF